MVVCLLQGILIREFDQLALLEAEHPEMQERLDLHPKLSFKGFAEYHQRLSTQLQLLLYANMCSDTASKRFEEMHELCHSGFKVDLLF